MYQHPAFKVLCIFQMFYFPGELVCSNKDKVVGSLNQSLPKAVYSDCGTVTVAFKNR